MHVIEYITTHGKSIVVRKEVNSIHGGYRAYVLWGRLLWGGVRVSFWLTESLPTKIGTDHKAFIKYFLNNGLIQSCLVSIVKYILYVRRGRISPVSVQYSQRDSCLGCTQNKNWRDRCVDKRDRNIDNVMLCIIWSK